MKLSLSAFNEKEEATPAVAMAAVVDKSVLTLADERPSGACRRTIT